MRLLHVGRRFLNKNAFLNQTAVDFQRRFQNEKVFGNRRPQNPARQFPNGDKIGIGLHIKVEGGLQKKLEAKTGVHIYGGAGFQFMRHLGTCTHIELEAGFYVRPDMETGVHIKHDA